MKEKNMFSLEGKVALITGGPMESDLQSLLRLLRQEQKSCLTVCSRNIWRKR